MTAKQKKVTIEEPEVVVPKDWRCSLQRPNNPLVEDVINFIESEGGPEPSRAKKCLREVREQEYEQLRIAGPGNEDLLGTIQGLMGRLDPLDATITKYERAHIATPTEVKDEAGKVAALLFSKRAALAERRESLNAIGAARREAQDGLFQSLNTSLFKWSEKLAAAAATDLWQDRPDRYHPERITVAVLTNVALIRRAAAFADRLGRQYQPKAAISQLTDMLDAELEIVLDRAAHTGVSLVTVMTNRTSRPAGPPSSLEQDLSSNLEENL